MIEGTIDNPTAEDLEAITRDVWESLQLDGAGDDSPSSSTPSTESVTASVSVSGDWNGHIAVQCPHATAQDLTSAMLGMSLDEIATEDVVDAVGELVNIIGGNVKGLMSSPNQLSLPQVVIGPAESTHWPKTDQICHIEVPAARGAVAVSVWSSTGG
jgi:chemotaxis protein CheX